MKHRIKRLLRRSAASSLHATGLRRAFRSGRRGVPVLMFHNVGNPQSTDYIPGHMKVAEATLDRLLAALSGAGYRTLTLRQMVEGFERGELPRDAVVLTFDDGYKDNHDVLLPLLRRHGATATIFVQTGPMHGRINWLHHYFWVLHRVGPHKVGEELAARLPPTAEGKSHATLRALPQDAVAAEYQLKRVLKYEVSAADRDRLLAEIFAAAGGDDAALAREVWLSPADCRALDAAGVELGAHTVDHLVLSSLDRGAQRAQIEGSLQDLRGWLGHDVASFAYPYGRSWDYNADTLGVLRELGLRAAITAMPGLNEPATERLELRRTAVSEELPLSELLCEVDGAFDWLARRGLDLRA
jgi:peptidoglycan/xylan/chitin deacetylase (PgdA/CDA1 family)